MPVDASIPLQVKPFEGMNPQQVLSLQHLSQQMQMQNEQLSEFRRKREVENQLRNIYSRPDAIDPTTKMPTERTLADIAKVDPATFVSTRGKMIEATEKEAITQKNIAQMRAALAGVDEKDRKIMNQIQVGAHDAYEAKLKETQDPAQATKTAQEFFSSRLTDEDKLGVLGKKYIEAGRSQPFDAGRSEIMIKAMRPLGVEKQEPGPQSSLGKLKADLDAGRITQKQFDSMSAKMEAPSSVMVNTATANNTSDETLKFIAQQYLSGDRTVVQGFGRSATMMGKIRDAITAEAKEQGMSPAATAQRVAEFEGQKSGQRALGTRSANIELAVNEASQFADLALDASGKFDRTGVKSFNDIQKAIQRRTASPELRQFEAANTSFINAYARAVNPNGVATVSDKDHARQMLDTGFAKGDYKAAITQLQKEMAAAQKSPGVVKEKMRELATGEAPQKRRASDADNDPLGIRGNH